MGSEKWNDPEKNNPTDGFLQGNGQEAKRRLLKPWRSAFEAKLSQVRFEAEEFPEIVSSATNCAFIVKARFGMPELTKKSGSLELRLWQIVVNPLRCGCFSLVGWLQRDTKGRTQTPFWGVPKKKVTRPCPFRIRFSPFQKEPKSSLSREIDDVRRGLWASASSSSTALGSLALPGPLKPGEWMVWMWMVGVMVQV